MRLPSPRHNPRADLRLPYEKRCEAEGGAWGSALLLLEQLPRRAGGEAERRHDKVGDAVDMFAGDFARHDLAPIGCTAKQDARCAEDRNVGMSPNDRQRGARSMC